LVVRTALLTAALLAAEAAWPELLWVLAGVEYEGVDVLDDLWKIAYPPTATTIITIIPTKAWVPLFIVRAPF
jgi:hypothetical protein